MPTRAVRISGLVALTLVAGAALAQSQKSIVGVWKLDATRSTPAAERLIEDTRVYEDAGNGMIRSIHTVRRADGSGFVARFEARADGHEYPITGMPSEGSYSLVLTPKGKNVEGVVVRRNGVIFARGESRISADGMTIVETIFGNKPSSPRTIRVYRRQ